VSTQSTIKEHNARRIIRRGLGISDYKALLAALQEIAKVPIGFSEGVTTFHWRQGSGGSVRGKRFLCKGYSFSKEIEMPLPNQ